MCVCWCVHACVYVYVCTLGTTQRLKIQHARTHAHTHTHTVYTHAFLVVHNGLSLCCAGEVIQSPWLIGAISVHLILDRSQVLSPVVGNLVQWHVRMYLYTLHCVWWGAVCVLTCDYGAGIPPRCCRGLKHVTQFCMQLTKAYMAKMSTVVD